MALDKVVDSVKLNGALKATADAIRSKTGATDSIVFDESTGFKSTIDEMEIGASEWELVMPATDITFSNGGEYMDFVNVYPLVSGNAYKVVWDGVEYEGLIATDIIFQEMNAVAIGNVGVLEGNPTAEPFVIGYIPSANGFGIFRMDGADVTTNVAIYRSAVPMPIIRPLEITENGTYTAPDGVDGFSPVVVSVSGGSVDGAYTVTFMSEDGSFTYGTKLVMNGDTCGDPIALGLFPTPTRESTAQYDYSFYGWALTADGAADGNALANITEDRTLYANFASAVRYYTINYYDGDSLLKTEQLPYGAMPTYQATKDDYVFMGWSPAVTAVTGNADYYAQWSTIITFANASWAQISEVCESGEAANVFTVGETRAVTTSEGHTYTLQIVGINHDDLSDGSGKAGITIIPVEMLPDTQKFNTSQKYWNTKLSYTGGGWPNSSIRTYLNNDFFNTLPSDLQAVIKSVKKISDRGYGGTTSETPETSDKVWLASAEEYGFAPSSYATGQGTKYAYFTNKQRKTRKRLNNSSAEKYLLRSCSMSSSGQVFLVSYDGSFCETGSGYGNQCISPGFCI